MKGRKKMSNRERTFLLMILPALILFVAFNTIPLITGAIYSFTNYRGYGDYDFVGFRNYIDLFSDERVRNSYWFTFKYAVAGTILINFLSLLLALGLNSRIRLLRPQHPRRTDHWLYLQFLLHLYRAGNWQGCPHRLPGKQYPRQ